MCGIVGYIGKQNATPILLNGLRKLEYRGYDSAGLAVIENGKIEIRRDAGKIENLVKIVKEEPLEGVIGIGHTRWATHGEPNARNAHPHVSNSGSVVVVHNGIVENYLDLKTELIGDGARFQSDTDTETIVLLIEKYLDTGLTLVEAVRKTLQRIKGAHGVVVMSTREPDKIIACRIGNAGGVVLGVGVGEMFIASDVPAIIEHTRKVVFLESGQMAIVNADQFQIETLNGQLIPYQIQEVAWDAISAEKGNYPHYMLKEIHEQVRSINDTMAGRVDFDQSTISIPSLGLNSKTANKIEKILITACGTAYHAGLVGKYLIEKFCRIPVEVDVASEFRYRDPIVDSKTAVIVISQSGETADTLAAMEEARRKGALILSIVNAIGSQAARYADGNMGMQAGPEIGVASTKAFTAPLVDLYMLAVLLADLRGVINFDQRTRLVNSLSYLPELVGKCLDREKDLMRIASAMQDAHDAIYLGRGIQMPIAYEGALKLKEISYIHAEAYPAGEMKHGPIALVDRQMPIIALAPKDPWYEKMISQIEQVKARGGKVFSIATDGDEKIKGLSDDVAWIPEIDWPLAPVLTVIPLQILAYQIANLKGLDIDQPRNLAKSVTVE
jgi:glutamine---fructose-6-phosphate transaminase (isomerizing)